ncbi:cyclopropane fatty acyl phospholipid synthase [Pontibacter anaerobius]|uniref:Cyclopropane fatty acyl phospholipid synthase n=1 Tax=Pontibacter anaerobius TaxID=2993940 RepID=A0ABT3RCB6_9BACT|nr:cyclopropane fatty acyl phospholipid synthase [Pontibacter anaerobius]MCX2739487.1 cyclopropane fatty acyl phospholipid synthase [Pontibacter anaerobius]
MATPNLQQQVASILATADVKINGPDPWDLQVHDERFYKRILTEGTLGLGESYMDGWWDCESIDQFVFKVLRADLYKQAKLGWRSVLQLLLAKLLNLQRKGKAARNAQRHYDIGNKLYQLMLDKRMVYSCAYWKDANNLDRAQENKLDLICRKLRLQPDQRILDIGCGWGSFARFAAEKYGVEVVGVTVSKEQAALAQELCKGLPVEIRLQDYRDVNEAFDHVVSVGMVEHVGYRNHRTFMQTAARCLKDEGLFLLHTIGVNYSKVSADPFTDTYIFPNCLIPSIKQLGAAMEHIFMVEDWHNFGPYYDNTLMAWFGNFDSNWEQLQGEYGERFYRMWKYYLLSSAGSFRARNNQLWQLVLSKKGVVGGYEAVR